jgi:hypothetical protein
MGSLGCHFKIDSRTPAIASPDDLGITNLGPKGSRPWEVLTQHEIQHLLLCSTQWSRLFQPHGSHCPTTSAGVSPNAGTGCHRAAHMGYGRCSGARHPVSIIRRCLPLPPVTVSRHLSGALRPSFRIANGPIEPPRSFAWKKTMGQRAWSCSRRHFCGACARPYLEFWPLSFFLLRVA